MKYIKDTLDFKIEEPSVITLGKFDGLHMRTPLSDGGYAERQGAGAQMCDLYF
mgnify:CR=1 FL=1